MTFATPPTTSTLSATLMRAVELFNDHMPFEPLELEKVMSYTYAVGTLATSAAAAPAFDLSFAMSTRALRTRDNRLMKTLLASLPRALNVMAVSRWFAALS